MQNRFVTAYDEEKGASAPFSVWSFDAYPLPALMAVVVVVEDGMVLGAFAPSEEAFEPAYHVGQSTKNLSAICKLLKPETL